MVCYRDCFYSVVEKDKKERQTIKNDDLSLSVHPTLEILNLWEDFKKVVEFIEANTTWLKPIMDRVGRNKLIFN